MDQAKKPAGTKRKWSARILLLALFVISFWAYQQFMINYESLESSNQLLSASLNNYMERTKQYAKDIVVYKENLAKAEANIKKIQKDNDQLKQKLALLGTLSDMESTVEELKAKNLALANELDDVKKKSPFADTKNIKTLNEGKDILAKYRDNVRKIKNRLNELNRIEHDKRIAANQEQERLMTQLGNNGYVTRDGKPMKMDVVLPNSQKNVNINVKFE